MDNDVVVSRAIFINIGQEIDEKQLSNLVTPSFALQSV